MEKNIKHNIMDKIHTGQVKQKPGWYFMLHTILVIILGIVLFFTSIFWSSFLLLTIHEYTVFAHVGIGISNLLQNILFWVFIICGIGIGVLCYQWLHSHTRLYRYRHVYTIITVTSILLGTGVAMNMVDTETRLARMGEQGVPGLSHIDKHIRPPRPSILTEGRIVFMDDDIFIIQEKNTGEKIYVKIPDGLLIIKNISTSDDVAIVGTREGAIIYAQDIIIK